MRRQRLHGPGQEGAGAVRGRERGHEEGRVVKVEIGRLAVLLYRGLEEVVGFRVVSRVNVDAYETLVDLLAVVILTCSLKDGVDGFVASVDVFEIEQPNPYVQLFSLFADVD